MDVYGSGTASRSAVCVCSAGENYVLALSTPSGLCLYKLWPHLKYIYPGTHIPACIDTCLHVGPDRDAFRSGHTLVRLRPLESPKVPQRPHSTPLPW